MPCQQTELVAAAASSCVLSIGPNFSVSNKQTNKREVKKNMFVLLLQTANIMRVISD